MVLEPPLLDAPAEEHAAVSAPTAASAAVARSGRDKWAKRIVQSSPAVGCHLSTVFRWRCQTTRGPRRHFARGTAQFAPDNHPNVRFAVQDVEQSGIRVRRGGGYPAVPAPASGSSADPAGVGRPHGLPGSAPPTACQGLLFPEP